MSGFSSPNRQWRSRLLTALVAASAVVAPIQSFAQTPTFNALISTPVTVGSGFPETATVGDINGDGKLDAIVPGTNGLRVMLGNGAGTFVDYLSVPADVTAANVVNLSAGLTAFLPRPVGGVGALQAVDMNNDGRLDLVTVETVGINFTNYSFIGVSLNSGNGPGGVPQFTTTHHWVPFLGARPVTIGDLNNDGWKDFIVGSCCGAVETWTSNGGNGTFTRVYDTGLTPGAGGPSVGQGVIADLNGDGRADYVVSSNQNGGANVFFGNGNGTFQATATYLPNGAVSVAVTDVNGDGRPDLLMGNLAGGSEGLLEYLNNGGGTFSAPVLYPIAGITGGFNGNGSLALADINGDGKLDAVMSDYDSNNGTHNVAVLLADGTGGFGAATKFTAAFVPTHVFVGDFTGDGKADVGVVLRNSRSFGVLTNTTPAPLPTKTLTILGGNGAYGEIAANVEYYNPATGLWQPAYLVGAHPWGQVPGTNSWINYKPSNVSDPGAGANSTNSTYWYQYRVRFTVPSDAINPQMTFSVKADNFVQVGINGTLTGGADRYLNYAIVHNVIDGQANSLNADGVFAQAIHTGENVITLNVGDFGGLNGFNFRIDLSMQTNESIDVVPVAHDTTAPVITGPSNITAEATSAAGASVTFTASAMDDTDGAVSVTSSRPSGSTFPLGLTTVNLSAIDAAGNTGTASFTVKVVDTTKPAVTVPASITAEATSADGAVVGYPAPTATDAVGVTSLDSTPVSGSIFPIGATTVVATAKDAAGNIGTGSFSVNVVDTTAPVLTVPANQTLEAASAAGTVATFAASATDAVGATITYDHASGETFPIGTTTVNVTAKDAAGNTTAGSFTITVRDTIAPALTVPASQTLEATSAAGAVANFAATYSDAVGVTSITYSIPTGSTFAIGTTTVNVTVGDAAGNTTSGSFTITVRDTTAPAVGSVTPSTAMLWPPNHQMVAIGLTIASSDIVGVARYNVTVTSDEADNGLGDGDTPNDIQIIGSGTMNPSLSLRAERAGNGNGRTYTIRVVAVDAAGNVSAAQTTTVSVPKSQAKK